MGPIPPGEWQTWQFFCSTGATSRVKLTRVESEALRGAQAVPRAESAAGVPFRAAVRMRAAAHENARERRQRRGGGFRRGGRVGSMRFLRGRVADSVARAVRRGKETVAGAAHRRVRRRLRWRRKTGRSRRASPGEWRFRVSRRDCTLDSIICSLTRWRRSLSPWCKSPIHCVISPWRRLSVRRIRLQEFAV
jgi:hypothetical protein